jgi:N-sulfoglucosamine sulfohydrolase
MNVLYLHCHDAGWVLSLYGEDAPAPQLEEWTRTATVFLQEFCCGPTCSRVGAALLAGVTAHESDMQGGGHRGFGFAEYRKHRGHRLRAWGYETVLAGVFLPEEATR